MDHRRDRSTRSSCRCARAAKYGPSANGLAEISTHSNNRVRSPRVSKGNLATQALPHGRASDTKGGTTQMKRYISALIVITMTGFIFSASAQTQKMRAVAA